jgi:hypothetical protein
LLSGCDFEKYAPNGERLERGLAHVVRTNPVREEDEAEEPTGSPTSAILSASAMQMQKIPKKMYHKSKLSWF